MRVLVACPACSQQLDATGVEPGTSYHCLCGERVTVPVARAHDAAVVRCTACGASRSEAGDSCSFCGSDFTLHERDLHTICPSCATRISDRARFCHHCGTAVMPQGRLGESTSKPCPKCGEDRRLRSRDLGFEGVSILECDRCAGLWLGHEAFEVLVERARSAAGGFDVDMLSVRRWDDVAVPERPGSRLYFPCPVCDQLMQRRNYAASSGVVIDVCFKHGAWFDHRELATILSWVRRGGEERQQRKDEEYERDRERRERVKELATVHAAPSSGEFLSYAPARSAGALAVLLEGLLAAGLRLFK